MKGRSEFLIAHCIFMRRKIRINLKAMILPGKYKLSLASAVQQFSELFTSFQIKK